MRQHIKRYAIWFLGWIFIILGILGLFLPVLQGILFLLIGLYLISNESPWAGRLLAKVRQRFPRLHQKFEAAKAKARDLQDRALRRKGRQAENVD